MMFMNDNLESFIWLVAGAGAFFCLEMGLTGYRPNFWLKNTQKQNATLLNTIISVDGMDRIWYDNQDRVYRDATGKQISTQPLKQEVRSCANLSRHLETLLKDIEINGKVLRANAFSFSEPQEVHRDYVFSVLYHKV